MKTSNISRRSILRGLGAGSVLLSGMWKSASAAGTEQPTRMALFFHGNGAHPDWAPTGSGSAFTLTPHLSGLEQVRNDIIIFRRLMAQRDMSLNPHKGATLDLSTAGGQDSLDQVLAKYVKMTQPTPIPSLELAIGRTNGGGGDAPSLALVGRQFLPGIRNPLFLYDRLTKAMVPSNPMMTNGGAEKAIAVRKSLLDYLRDDVSVLRGRVGGPERMRIDSYLDSIRDLESSLGGFTGGVMAGAACTKGEPPKTAMDFEAHMSDMPMVNRMFMDTIAMGFACGVTRVSNMMWGGGECHEALGWLGVGQWHSTSHGNPAGSGQQTLIKLHTFLSNEIAYFIQKLKALDLFDSTQVLWGTQNGNSTETGFSKENHDRRNALFILAGRSGGYYKTLGKVVDCNEAYHNDLYLHMANAFGLKTTTVGKPEWCKGLLPGVV
ncbi:MAG TPA: DUF1552 domain-containing protein [Polyangia bacterium]|jgi:hypothetical protein|nr:DUF1552 domain-containing protein [Polyangia bacterium]